MPYYFARSLLELPLFLLLPLLFSAIVYFGVGLTVSAAQFFKFFLVLALQIQCALSWSYFLSAMIADGTTVMMIGPIVVFPFMLLGGFFANLTSQLRFLQWLNKISPLRYGFEALGWNEWGQIQNPNCKNMPPNLQMSA